MNRRPNGVFVTNMLNDIYVAFQFDIKQMVYDFFLFLQGLYEFVGWFEKVMRESYFSNSASKLEVATKLTSHRIQDVIISLNTFRTNMKKQFDSPISSFLTKASREMTKYYIEVLSKFIGGTNYFGTQKDFREIGSNMKIWRIPVSKTIRILYC